MQVLAKYNAVYTTHLRSEGDNLLESLTATIHAAKKAHLKKIQISHLKTAGTANWHKLDAALNIIRAANAEGLDIRFDRYPYTESQTMLSVILPAPFDTMPDRDITRELQDEKAVAAIRRSLSMRSNDDWQRWRITGTTHPKWKNFIGCKYSSLTEDKINAVIDQLRFDATTATIGAAGLSEENMLKIITDDLCMAGSDGNALPLSTCFGTAHPRAFGAVAEFIRLKLAHGQSIGKCIKAVSSTPAEFFQLPDIGVIQCGKKADITVFSPDDIGCKADFSNPHCFADGIKMTMLNGAAEFY
jgi:N-acyl-D-amino-acid deacylase